MTQAAITDREIEVNFYNQGELVHQAKVMLDESGEALLEDLPIEIGLQPVVIVPHAGVTYQNSGKLMDKANPTQTMEIVCYEVTNDVPAWKIHLRQVMLSHAPDGLKVTEILLIDNPAERYPVIIQFFKGDDRVHVAQVDVKGDDTYEYKFRVRNVVDGKVTNIFEGDYTVKIFKVVESTLNTI